MNEFILMYHFSESVSWENTYRPALFAFLLHWRKEKPNK